MRKQSFFLLFFIFLGELFYLTASPKLVNVALPIWGTEVTASSEHAAVHGANNVAEGNAQISKTIEWQTFRGKFRMSMELEPAAGLWVYHPLSGHSSPSGKYSSGPYEVHITESAPDTLARLIRWNIRRTDNKPFKVLENNIECKTSYAGVYKLYHPQRMSQQNYFIDLPFRFNHISTVHDNHPLIWDDAQRARLLGVTTIQIDAGWNIPEGQGYSFDNEGDYSFSNRFPNAVRMIQDIHAAGQRVILHVAPLLMGKNANAWIKMNDCLLRVNGVATPYLEPRLKKVQDYLLTSWEHMFTTYDIDGLWYDFLEFPLVVDAPPDGKEIISYDIFQAYTKLMQSLYHKATGLNPNAVIILRRPYANLNSKTFCTHIWPMDVPQDYNMNRRDVIFMKTFGEGVITRACCTSWTISESDLNVARQMASITMAGVPAFSTILADSPSGHNRIMKAWLEFYEANKKELALGDLTPLLPTPPSAAIRVESEKKTFFGFFEALPGLIDVSGETESVVIVNAFARRTTTRLEDVREGKWELRLLNQYRESGGFNNNHDRRHRCPEFKYPWSGCMSYHCAYKKICSRETEV